MDALLSLAAGKLLDLEDEETALRSDPQTSSMLDNMTREGGLVKPGKVLDIGTGTGIWAIQR